jgi:hypothetical protein
MQASSQERIAGVVLVLFSLTFLVLAFFIPAPPFKQQLGPEAFPKAIGLALLVLSVVYLVQQTRGRAGEDEARAAIADEAWRPWAQQNATDLTSVGLWGVPSFRIGDYVTWGQDRIEYLDDRLRRHFAAPAVPVPST